MSHRKRAVLATPEAIRIYAGSFGKIQSFCLYRSMEAYQKSLGKTGTSMVLSPDSAFFRYFLDKDGKSK